MDDHVPDHRIAPVEGLTPSGSIVGARAVEGIDAGQRSGRSLSGGCGESANAAIIVTEDDRQLFEVPLSDGS
jgi:hypothetical protein